MFPANVQTKDGAHTALHVIGGAHPGGAACAAFLIREMDLEAVRVLVLNAGAGERLVGPGAKTRHVPGEHIQRRLSLDHPFGGQFAHATVLRKAGDDAVAAEIPGQFRHRAEQHGGIGRPDHRAVDHPLDPRRADRWHAFNRAQHVFLDPLQIVGEQLMAKSGGRAILGPEFHVLLIGADQQALALLAQVVFAIAVRNRRQAAVQRRNRVDGFGDEILMLGGDQRQRKARHRRHLAPPEPRRIDHPRRADIALVGAHDPGAIRLRLGACDGRKAVDVRPPRPRPDGIGIGHARRVNIAAIGFKHDAANAVEIDQRVQTLGLIAAHLMEVHAIAPRLGLLQAQLMLARLGLGQIQAAGLEHAAGLARLCLQLLVKVHGIMLKAADVGAVVQPVNIRRRMPCAARRQL